MAKQRVRTHAVIKGHVDRLRMTPRRQRVKLKKPFADAKPVFFGEMFHHVEVFTLDDPLHDFGVAAGIGAQFHQGIGRIPVPLLDGIQQRKFRIKRDNRWLS